MLPIIAGVIGVGVLTYLYNEAKSDYSNAVDDYYNEVDRQEEEIKERAKKAKKRYELDILYKLKKSKIEISNSIYSQIQSAKRDLKEININLKKLKDDLDVLFFKKRIAVTREKKIIIQEQINSVIEVRQESFKLRDETKEHISKLYAELKEVNREIAEIKESIKRVENS